MVVRRLRRQCDKQVKLPQTVGRGAGPDGRSWASRPGKRPGRKTIFLRFRPLLEKTIALKREQAEALGYPQCPYDALLDDYEPEERTANVAAVLAGLREQLVPLVAEIQQSGRRPNVELLHGTFPVDVQERFGREAAAAIGFDFARGRLDVTAHPFCTTLGPARLPHHHPLRAAILQRGLFRHFARGGPRALRAGLAHANSTACRWARPFRWGFTSRSRGCGKTWWAAARRSGGTFIPGPGPVSRRLGRRVACDEFYFAINDVRPSLVRVEADEVTYNLHILIRFELERAMLDGDLPAAELPGAWDEKYRQYLGIDAARRPPGRAAGRALECRAGRLLPHVRPGQSLRRPVFCPGRRSSWATCRRRWPRAIFSR